MGAGQCCTAPIETGTKCETFSISKLSQTVLQAIEMHWMINLRNLVLDAKNDRQAARLLHDSDGNLGAALVDRARFLRECWKSSPETAEELKEAACQHAAQSVAAEIEVEIDDVSRALRAVVDGTPVPPAIQLEDKKLHHKLLYHGLRYLESITHYNPWSEATSRAGRALSNLTEAPFTLFGAEFASTESFLQSMRLRPGSVSPSRSDVAAIAAVEARAAGRAARKAEKGSQAMEDPVWLWGQEDRGPVERQSAEFDAVMTEALIAKIRSHHSAAKALAACVNLPVVHYVRRRGRYRINAASHLPRCLPAVLAALDSELPGLTGEDIGYWLRPSSANVQLV